mmetsp:Transcript_26811/g.39695  ORF Transcript_26811/g.39695 Transcript_26811/m.39695 type:complete len:129 (+) Transcript_26811:1017-1403(+)
MRVRLILRNRRRNEGFKDAPAPIKRHSLLLRQKHNRTNSLLAHNRTRERGEPVVLLLELRQIVLAVRKGAYPVVLLLGGHPPVLGVQMEHSQRVEEGRTPPVTHEPLRVLVVGVGVGDQFDEGDRAAA